MAEQKKSRVIVAKELKRVVTIIDPKIGYDEKNSENILAESNNQVDAMRKAYGR